jgi:predicted  nucleic acid-binding Zn-ribbon protein
MVFGWGKKKSEKQEPEMVPQKKQILLSDVPNVVDEIRSIRTKTIIAKAKTFKNKIKPSCETILHIAIDLEHDTLNVDDIDIHLKRLVERGKKEVISIIKRESIVQLPEINSYDDVKIFNVTSSKMLKKIGDALGRQSNVIHIFAKKYAGKLKGDLKIMTDGNDEITGIITNHTELETKTENILDIISDIQQSRKLIDNLGDQEKQNNKTIDELVAKIERDKEEIKNIKNSSEYTEFLHINEKLDSLSTEKNKIKDEIEHQFTKISRPLNKYVYVSSLDKPQKKLLVNLIANPYNELIDSNKRDILQILESTRKSVQSGSVSVKDIDKSLAQIDETLSFIDIFIEKIASFNNSKNDLENKLSVFSTEELRQKESQLTRHQNDKLALETKIKSRENELRNTTELIPEHIKSLESILNQISAVQYTIRSEE